MNASTRRQQTERPRSVRSLTRLAPLALLALPACDDSRLPVADDGGERDAAPYHTGTPERACAGCHPNHVDEWKISPHAYAMRDPVFHAMVRLGQQQTEGKLGQFCVQCHSPIATADEEAPVVFDESTGTYTQETQALSAAAMDGVSCEVCHSTVEVTSIGNAAFVMKRDGVRRATISDPVENAVHESAFSPLHGTSRVCGSCHQVINDFDVALERTHMEWVQSRFNGAQDCQDCHMPEYEGPAAVGEKQRRLHRHTFVGVDVSLLPEDEFPGYQEGRDLAEALLQSSAVLTATADVVARSLDVVIENKAGHALPSGATADREMWIELLVRDAGGAIVLESGTLDENGDLRVDLPERTTRPGTDPQLVLYTQRMYFDPALPADGLSEQAHVVDFLWEPNFEQSRLVPAGAKDRVAYRLDSLPTGSYTAELRLLFRTFAPHLLRKLEHEAGLSPDVKDRVPTVEMATARVDFAIP